MTVKFVLGMAAVTTLLNGTGNGLAQQPALALEARNEARAAKLVELLSHIERLRAYEAALTQRADALSCPCAGPAGDADSSVADLSALLFDLETKARILEQRLNERDAPPEPSPTAAGALPPTPTELQAYADQLRAYETDLAKRAVEGSCSCATDAPTADAVATDLKLLLFDLEPQVNILERRLNEWTPGPAPSPSIQDVDPSDALRQRGLSVDPGSRATLARALRTPESVAPLLDALPSIQIEEEVAFLRAQKAGAMHPAVGLFSAPDGLTLYQSPGGAPKHVIPRGRAVLVLLEHEPTGWLGVMAGTEPGFIDPSALRD